MKDIYIECGNGWKPLIQEYLDWVDNFNEDKSGEDRVETLQIKEKFGRLTIYPSYYPNGLMELLNDLERKSAKICEKCGKDIKGSRVKNYWIYTLCDKCFKEMEEKNEEIMNEFNKKL